MLRVMLSLCSLSHTLLASQPEMGSCNALMEIIPWQISDVVVLDALPTTPVHHSIHFRVRDINPGLEFDTYCRWPLPVVIGSRPEEAQSWHQCEDGRVGFLYQPSSLHRAGNLQIRRSYLDDWYVVWNKILSGIGAHTC